eukprot:c16126_g1_i1 orf=190-981(-)
MHQALHCWFFLCRTGTHLLFLLFGKITCSKAYTFISFIFSRRPTDAIPPSNPLQAYAFISSIFSRRSTHAISASTALHSPTQGCPPEMVSCSSKKWRLSIKKQTTASVDDTWELASKFFGLKLWIPGLQVCDKIKGEEGTPGCIRYCASAINASDNESSPRRLVWVKEELLAWNPVTKEYSYTILDSNLGLENYKATISVSDPCHDRRALVTWNVEFNPVHGRNEEEFLRYIRRLLERNITSLEQASHSLSLTAQLESHLSRN